MDDIDLKYKAEGIVANITEFIIFNTQDFIREKTNSFGRLILIISIASILFFSKVVDFASGSIIGFSFNINNNNMNVFLTLLAIALFYLVTIHIINIRHDIKDFKRKYSLKNKEIDASIMKFYEEYSEKQNLLIDKNTMSDDKLFYKIFEDLLANDKKFNIMLDYKKKGFGEIKSRGSAKNFV